MPAATTKDELLDVAEREFEKLTLLLDRVDGELAVAKDDDDTSVKDLVAHRAHWIGLFLGWYHDGLAGAPVHFPAQGYTWSDLKRYNADLRARQVDLTWPDARRQLDGAHAELMRFIGDRSDDELYGAPMVGADNHWTPGRWAEAAGPSHYRSAAKYIRGRLRAVG